MPNVMVSAPFEPYDTEDDLDADVQREAEELLFKRHSEVMAGIPQLVVDTRTGQTVARMDVTGRISHTQPNPATTEVVRRPEHYTHYKIEPINFIMENALPFCEGNIVKYVLRWRFKNGVQDLEKAARYIEMLIKQAKGDPGYHL